jgi:hypothetical protein
MQGIKRVKDIKVGTKIERVELDLSCDFLVDKIGQLKSYQIQDVENFTTFQQFQNYQVWSQRLEHMVKMQKDKKLPTY